MKDHKKVIGPRAIIVSSLEEPHKAAAGKIWFQLQKAGIESTFLNLKSKYPSVESIRDGINLLKRTGASSIISIGNGTITDYGKALQFAVDSPASLNGLFQDPTSIPALKATPRISHVIIPTTPTPNHYVSSCQVIHPEENILLEIPAYAPSVSSFPRGGGRCMALVCSIRHFPPRVSRRSFAPISSLLRWVALSTIPLSRRLS